jgi:hypothetical protein
LNELTSDPNGCFRQTFWGHVLFGSPPALLLSIQSRSVYFLCVNDAVFLASSPVFAKLRQEEDLTLGVGSRTDMRNCEGKFNYERAVQREVQHVLRYFCQRRAAKCEILRYIIDESLPAQTRNAKCLIVVESSMDESYVA